MAEYAGDKYRSSKEYLLVYCALINAAQNRGTVTYQELAEIMGLPLTGSHMGREVGNMIGYISEDEVRLGRPMLSAIVVDTTGRPKSGLYGWAREIGRLQGEGPEVEERFLEQERRAIYRTWQKSFKGK